VVRLNVDTLIMSHDDYYFTNTTRSRQ